MIKPINAIRSTAFAFVTAGALLAGCANNNNTKASTQNQTEVVSKGVTDAIKANALQTPTYSNEHNKKLDNRYIKAFSEPEDIEAAKNDLTEVYENMGTFWASAEIQRSMDYEYLKLALSKFSSAFNNQKYVVSAFEELANKENEVLLTWYNDVYHNSARIYEDNLASDAGVPSFEKVSKSCDDFIKTLSFLSKDEIQSYNEEVSSFKVKQKNPDSIQAKSDLIAFKVYTTDMIVLYNKLSELRKITYGSMYDSNPENDKYNVLKYFDKYLKKNAQPTP